MGLESRIASPIGETEGRLVNKHLLTFARLDQFFPNLSYSETIHDYLPYLYITSLNTP